MTRLLLILLTLFSLSICAQEVNCCTTYTYEGFIDKANGQKPDISLNVMMLLDSTLVGSYHYNTKKSESFDLAGKLLPDNTFTLSEWNDKEINTGSFTGKMAADKSFISGQWAPRGSDRNFAFELKEVKSKSYWDYIRKNRALPEYTDLAVAILEKDSVLSIDVANQGINKLPEAIVTLPNIVSMNLLGNEFESFPPGLAKLTTLDELSLSSNSLTHVGPEIGELKNLRILIMNFNSIQSLPKEIGLLTNLLYLEIGRNELTTLPEEIKYLTNLQELHIEGNKLSEEEKKRIRQLLPNCVVHF